MKKLKKKESIQLVMALSLIFVVALVSFGIYHFTHQGFIALHGLYDIVLVGGGIGFTDGISNPMGATYLGWDGKTVQIIAGQGGIPDGNFDKLKYIVDERHGFLTSLAENDVGDGSVCEVRVPSIGVKNLDGYSGLNPNEYPIPRDQWLQGTLVRLKDESDWSYERVVTSGGKPVFGFIDFQCVLKEAYPMYFDNGTKLGDSFTIDLRLLSDTSGDVCGGIVCEDSCVNGVLKYDGVCDNSTGEAHCIYQTKICEFGCYDEKSCEPDPCDGWVVPSDVCTDDVSYRNCECVVVDGMPTSLYQIEERCKWGCAEDGVMCKEPSFPVGLVVGVLVIFGILGFGIYRLKQRKT